MNCPGCHRDNDPRRHYCGRCGANLSPVCRGCHFVNTADDRFCGGCGDLMTWNAAPGSAHARPAPTTLAPVVHMPAPVALPAPRLKATTVPAPMAPAIATVTPRRTDVITADDLAELLAAATAPAASVGLPEANIGQDDLDALFGGVP